ncbi:MAG TPA: PQQ-binding-like beta-propeller repeat protein [Phycisphaerae bacterium]|nr:PQQ-binding-like beta-propeller repeat protein [Phycisphaerae bacterium]
MRMPRSMMLPVSALVVMSASLAAVAADFVSPQELKRLDLQRYWALHLPLGIGEQVTHLALVDDTIYAISTENRALSVHAPTGVIRWSNFVGEPGQTVRGPSHASKYAFFTAAASVRVFDRQTGELATAPRSLRGFVIEVAGENATISIGEDHGVVIGDTLNVYRISQLGGREGETIAKLKVISVDRRSSRGHLERVAEREAPKPGCPVEADVQIPIQEVKLPFAASSAAVSDNKWIYFGGANERFYAIEMNTGVEQWALGTPHTISATPVLIKDNLYIAGQDGQVICCTKQEKAKNWTFTTEAPIFADLAVTSNRVFVASTDRSLYCLDRLSGKRLWRERFDKPLTVAPAIVGNHVYQQIEEEGLYVLDAESGKRMWHRPQGGKFLGEFGEDAYLISGEEGCRIIRLSPATGRKKDEAPGMGIQLAVAGLTDQSIFLGDAMGDLVCLRPASAPHLRPEQLREVLRNDHKNELAAQIKPRVVEKKPSPVVRSLFEDDDGLASRSTAQPVGGHGLPGAVKAETKKPTSAPAKVEEGEEGEKPAAAEGEKTEEGEAKEGEAKEGEDKSADEGEEKSDEKGDAKSGENKAEKDEKSKDEGDKDEDDSGDKDKDEKKPDDEGGG